MHQVVSYKLFSAVKKFSEVLHLFCTICVLWPHKTPNLQQKKDIDYFSVVTSLPWMLLMGSYQPSSLLNIEKVWAVIKDGSYLLLLAVRQPLCSLASSWPAPPSPPNYPRLPPNSPPNHLIRPIPNYHWGDASIFYFHSRHGSGYFSKQN